MTRSIDTALFRSSLMMSGMRRAAVRPLTAAVVATLSLLTVLTTLAVAGSAPDDSRIQSSIRRYLAAETTVPPDGIDVHVDDGIVMLSGTVSNLLQKDRAERIAQSVKGVRSVVDNIRVQPLVRADEIIARDVRAALAQPPLDRLGDITVTTDKGVVTLRGTVDSWVRSRMATRKAMAIKGVSEIVNQIAVAPSRPRDDKSVRMDVVRRLIADLFVEASDIDVTVDDGRVSLSGTVRTAAEKRRAAENAWIAGVVAVQDRQLSVRWPETERLRRPSPYVHRSDRAVLRAVEDALLMDPRVNAANPTVSVTNGAVTLSGVVDTLYAKQAAQEDALNTTGVWKVDNQLQLRYRAFPTDDEIERMIGDVLARDAELYDQPIQVAVEDNHVTMAGSVQTEGQKVRAANIVSQVDGVLTLNNRIRVTAGTDGDDSSDAEIAAAVGDQLFWSPYVDRDAITVDVTDGRVLLKGDAANRFVGRIAVSNAFEGGARSVHTRLRLDSGGMMVEHFTDVPDFSGPLGPAAVPGLWR